MKKINRIFSLVAIVAALTSCQKESLEVINPSVPNTGSGFAAELPAYEAEVGSKTAFAGNSFTWTTGDQLGVYVPSSNSFAAEVLTLATGDGTTSATFGTDDLTDPSSEYVYAVYPGVESNFTTEGSVKYAFTLNAAQTQEHAAGGALTTSSIGKYAAMYGRTAEVVSGKALSIPFTHVNSIFDFVLTDIPSGTKINSLTLTTDGNFATTATVDIAAATMVLSGESTSIKVSLDENGTGTSQTIRLAMFPETVASGKEWTVKLNVTVGQTTSDMTFIKPFSEAKTYEAGHAYTAALSYSVFTPIVKELTTSKRVRGVLRDANKVFVAHYAFDFGKNTITWNYIDARDKKLKHITKAITVTENNITWTGVEIATGKTITGLTNTDAINAIGTGLDGLKVVTSDGGVYSLLNSAASSHYYIWVAASDPRGDASQTVIDEIKAYVGPDVSFTYGTNKLDGIELNANAEGREFDFMTYENGGYHQCYPSNKTQVGQDILVFTQTNERDPILDYDPDANQQLPILFATYHAPEGMIIIRESPSSRSFYFLSPTTEHWMRFENWEDVAAD